MRGEVRDGSIELRRREIVEEVRMVVAQMLRSELDVVRSSRGWRKREEQGGKKARDHRDNSFKAWSIQSRRHGMSASPYRSVK